jgi:DNA polymerase-4
MDCFYAAVEMRDNPELRNVPIAVGGNGPRSVLCTCNYIAREFGVRSAMPNGKALVLCPDLIIVNGRMDVYKAVSKQIRAIFERYTDIIEPLSLDEAYLDVTDVKHLNGSATLIAQQIRKDIYDELQLTASAGIAPSKFLAKIASDENKPNGQCVVTPDKIDEFVENLPLKKINGIGPKTAKKLKKNGFETCADVRASSIKSLSLIMGKFANVIYERSHGVDNRELEVSRERKSLAIETTFARDISDSSECLDVIDNLFLKLEDRLANVGSKVIVKQGVKLKFSDFNQTTVEQQSDFCDKQTFKSLLIKALERSNDRKVRLIGLTLGFSNNDVKSSQLSFTFE